MQHSRGQDKWGQVSGMTKVLWQLLIRLLRRKLSLQPVLSNYINSQSQGPSLLLRYIREPHPQNHKGFTLLSRPPCFLFLKGSSQWLPSFNYSSFLLNWRYLVISKWVKSVTLGCSVLAGQIKLHQINTCIRKEHLMFGHKEVICFAWQHGRSVAEVFYESSSGWAWRLYALYSSAEVPTWPAHLQTVQATTCEWVSECFCVVCPRKVNPSYSLRGDQSPHLLGHYCSLLTS